MVDSGVKPFSHSFRLGRYPQFKVSPPRRLVHSAASFYIPAQPPPPPLLSQSPNLSPIFSPNPEKVVAELELERHRHEDTSRALAKSHESRAHAEAEADRLSRRLEEERGGAGGARAALAAEREAARLAREEAEDARTAVAELDAAVAELGAQKRVLVAGLRSRERALGDRCAGAEARAEEAAMMRRAAEARVRELEEDAERREAAQADGEIRLQRLRAEKRILLAEVRRGAGAGAGAGAGLAVSPGGFRDRRDDDGGGVRDVGRDVGGEGARGREGVAGGSGSSSRKSSFSPRSSTDGVQDNKVWGGMGCGMKDFSGSLVRRPL